MRYRTYISTLSSRLTLAAGLVVISLPLSFATACSQSMPSPTDSIAIVPGNRLFLEPNAPNPFTVDTRIGYTLDKDTHVILSVHDFFYDRVLTLVDADEKIGRHVVDFVPTNDFASGFYFYVLQTDSGVLQRRMMYNK